MIKYRRYWKHEQLLQIFNTESRQKAREIFLQTHHPFMHIHVDFCKEEGQVSTSITESELLKIVHQGNLAAHNRLFLIVGEAGSGKSELCQWLEYHLDRAHILPIYIPRSMTTALQVAKLLQENLALHWPTYHIKQVPPELEAHFVITMATMLLYEKCPIILDSPHIWELFFSDTKFMNMLVSWFFETPNIPYQLDRQNLYDWIYQNYALMIGDAEAIHRAVEEILLLAIERRLWIRDIHELLTTLSKTSIQNGKRPMLIIEDFTAFQMIGDVLLDYLLDLTSGHYDAIIGMTTGYEQTQLTQASLTGDLTHIHQRLRGRFVLSDNLGHSYGLEEDIVEFTHRYMQVLRINASTCSFADELYPFTPTLLQRAYHLMHEDGNSHKTPRLFIEHVLAAVLTSELIPSFVLDNTLFLERAPQLFRQEDVGDETLCSILRWYGDIEEHQVVLDPQIPAWWGVPIPSTLIQDGKIRIARTFASAQLGSASLMSSLWEQEIRELQQWLETGGIYPSRETLKRGIERVLLSLGDPRVLGNHHVQSASAAQVYYTRGEERLPIILDGASGDVPSTTVYIQIPNSHESEERGLLEELAYLHLSGAPIPQTSRNVVLTLTWAQRHWDAYHAKIQQHLANLLGGVTLEQLVFVAWHLVTYLQGLPWSTAPHVQSFENEAISLWGNSTHYACFSNGEAILHRHESIRRLFIGMFMGHDSLLDVVAFRHVQQTTDRMNVLRILANLSPKSLRTLPYKIRPLGEALSDLLIDVQRYAQSLVAIDVPTSLANDLSKIEEKLRHLHAQHAFVPEHFDQDIQVLQRQCLEIGIVWQNEWNAPIAMLRDLPVTVIDQLISDLKYDQDLGQQILRESGDVWRYQSFHLSLSSAIMHPYWGAVQILRAIQQSLIYAAHLRFSKVGKPQNNTKRYKQLLITLQHIQQEISHE